MTHKETRDLIASVGPVYPVGLHTSAEDAVKVKHMTDGTETVVQITLYGQPIGTGRARRRKGDQRDDELGMVLALTRAFTDAATQYAGALDRMLHPGPEPDAEVIRAMRRSARDERRKTKDEKRRAAREQHRHVYGWDHNDRNAAFNRRAD
jgi:hypothetical protein